MSPTCTTSCDDCGVGTLTIGEYYMVKDHIWELAWADRRKTWHEVRAQQILCIGCLEGRLGRTLTARDFSDVPCNSEDYDYKSHRLLHRLTTYQVKFLDKRNFRPLIKWMLTAKIGEASKRTRRRMVAALVAQRAKP
jgi:hypothetical protein